MRLWKKRGKSSKIIIFFIKYNTLYNVYIDLEPFVEALFNIKKKGYNRAMNVYLLVSDSYKKLDKEVNKITQESNNVIKYDLRKDRLIDVINEASYFSFDSEKKFIVVKSNTLFKQSKKDSEEQESKDIKLLESYLQSPSSNSIIIFTSMEMPDKRRKIFKKIDGAKNAIILPSLGKKDLINECQNLLQEKGYKIDYETANYIVENSYVNYDILTNELEKIYLLLKPQQLNINLIKNIVSLSLTDNIFNYINAIIKNDLENALKYAQNFETLKVEPTMVLILLYKEVQMLYLLNTNIDAAILQKHFHKEDWQMKAYFSKKNSCTISELEKMIITLADFDFKLKKGLIDRSVLIDLLTLELCA